MNIERTMKFILQQQTEVKESFHRNNRRMGRMERDLAQTNGCWSRHASQWPG